MKRVSLARLRKERTKLRIIMIPAALIATLAFFAMIGYVGHFDYADETHTPMTKAEESATWTGVWVSCAIFAISGGIAGATMKNEEQVAKAIAQRRYEHRRALKQMEKHGTVSNAQVRPAPIKKVV